VWTFFNFYTSHCRLQFVRLNCRARKQWENVFKGRELQELRVVRGSVGASSAAACPSPSAAALPSGLGSMSAGLGIDGFHVF